MNLFKVNLIHRKYQVSKITATHRFYMNQINFYKDKHFQII